MVVYEKISKNVIKIYSDANRYIRHIETGYKCGMTIDAPKNFEKYEETEEDLGGLVQELYGDNLIRSRSANGKYLLQNETQLKYAEAIDIPNHYTYTETDEDIPPMPEV